MARPDLLRFTSKGIYCERADVFIDPRRPVPKAIITHGHADHARKGHGSYLAHEHTVAIMKHRLGKNRKYQGASYGETVSIQGVNFSFIPAGHILGSCQIKVEHQGRVEVVTGDYKLENDGISGAYEAIPCHKIITECTFGSPIYQWRDQEIVKQELNDWIQQNSSEGISSVLFGYSLGKAQRLLSILETSLPIYVHSSVHELTEIYRGLGVKLPPTIGPTDEKVKRPAVIITPSSADSAWLDQFAPFKTSFASGWMALRSQRKTRRMDKGFVISDHMDWHGLQVMINECAPEKVVCTHGSTETYARYLRGIGINAITDKDELAEDNSVQ